MKNLIILALALLSLVSCQKQNGDIKTRIELIDSLVIDGRTGEADSLLNKIKPGSLTDDEDKAMYYVLASHLRVLTNKYKPDDRTIDFSINHYESTGDKKNLAVAYYMKGTELAISNKLQEAIPYMKRAEDLETQVNQPQLRYSICVNLSYVYSALWANKIAITYARKAIEVAKQQNRTDWLCLAYNCIAASYYDLGMKDSAYAYISKIEPQLDKITYYEEKAGYLSNIGTMYHELGDYKKAEKYLKMSIAIQPHEHNQANLARNYYATGKSREADSIIKAIWPKLDHDLKTEVLQLQAEMAEKRGDFKTATDLYKRAKIMRDSLEQDKRTEDATTTKHELDMEKYKDDTNKKELAAIIIALIATLTVAATGITLYKKKINKAKKAIADYGMTIKELTAKVDELERADRKHSREADALRRKIRKLKDEQNEILGRGQRLYDDITAGGTTATWKKQDFDEFIEFYRVSHPDVVADAEDNYRRLSSTNIFYLILTDMGHGDDDAQRIMCMTAGALRTMKSRINGKRKNA